MYYTLLSQNHAEHLHDIENYGYAETRYDTEHEDILLPVQYSRAGNDDENQGGKGVENSII